MNKAHVEKLVRKYNKTKENGIKDEIIDVLDTIDTDRVIDVLNGEKLSSFRIKLPKEFDEHITNETLNIEYV